MPHFRRPRSLLHAARQGAAGLLTVLALVLALRPSPAPSGAGGPHSVAVAVSAHDLPAGTVLDDEDLATARYPPEAAPAGVAGAPEQLVGRTLAGSVRAREPITDARLVGPGVTSLLSDGQVAAPVRLADLAVAALVRAGDHVDVLATAPDAPAAEVVAADVLVLAASGPGADPSSARDDAGLLVLAVDDATAARLAAVATTATLTVSLPPP